jgi:hypothetical protein
VESAISAFHQSTEKSRFHSKQTEQTNNCHRVSRNFIPLGVNENAELF